MPKAKALSLADAVQIYRNKTHEEIFITRSGKIAWYDNNFVSWISSLGYHIEITGDEFESMTITDKLA